MIGAVDESSCEAASDVVELHTLSEFKRLLGAKLALPRTVDREARSCLSVELETRRHVHFEQVYALLLASRTHCEELQRLGEFIERQQVARLNAGRIRQSDLRHGLRRPNEFRFATGAGGEGRSVARS